MSFKTLLLVIAISATLPSCKKDLATPWVGTYTGVAGSNNLNRVVISKVNESTIKMELQTGGGSLYYTYTTISNGKLASASAVAISEDGTIFGAGSGGVYHFSGGGSLSGNTLTLNGSATQTGATTLYYTFTGSK